MVTVFLPFVQNLQKDIPTKMQQPHLESFENVPTSIFVMKSLKISMLYSDVMVYWSDDL
jgi:hypothetical protein